MKIRHLLLAGLLAISNTLYAIEDISVAYTYGGDADLSGISPSLKIGEFGDDRGLDNPRFITNRDLGNAAATEGYQADAPLADIVQSAFAQAFAKAGATVVDAEQDMQIVGSIASVDARVVDRAGVESIQITIRTNFQLQGGGRTIWQTVLFGRGVVPAEEGLAAAINASLDRTIRELVNDDYFLLELQ